MPRWAVGSRQAGRARGALWWLGRQDSHNVCPKRDILEEGSGSFQD